MPGYRKFRKVTDEFIDDFVRVAMDLFEKEGVSIGLILDALKDSNPTDAAAFAAIAEILGDVVGPNGDFADEWYARFRALVTKLYKVAANDVSATLGFDFTIKNPNVQAFIDLRSRQLTQLIGKTTSDRVLSAVNEWAASSPRDGVGVLAKMIREDAVGQSISRVRAKRIAVTESGVVYNQAQYKTASDTRVLREKKWITQGDARVRKSHAQMERVGWIPIDSTFPNGLLHPGDPNGPAGEVINCRCTILFRDGP